MNMKYTNAEKFFKTKLGIFHSVSREENQWPDRFVSRYVYEDYLHKILIKIFVEHIFDINIHQVQQSFHAGNNQR